MIGRRRAYKLLIALAFVVIILTPSCSQIVRLIKRNVLPPFDNTIDIQDPLREPMNSQLLSLNHSQLYFPRTRIPFTIHQQGANIQSLVNVKRNTDTFGRSQIEHTLWTDAKIDAFVKARHPEYYTSFRNFPHHIYRSDLARYMILNQLGGLYSDTDTTLLKDYDQWVPEAAPPYQIRFILGIEQDATMRSDWKDWYARPFQLCQWTFASTAQHPILERAIQESFGRLKKSSPMNKGNPGFKNYVLETTGPGLFTDAVFWYLETRFGITARNLTNVLAPRIVGDILILPQTSFAPGLGHSQSYGDDHPLSFVRHHFSGSWKEKQDRV